MSAHIRVGRHAIGPDTPVFVIGEIGINHNGDLQVAKDLIDVAAEAGCDAVKFQKRTPELCVPEEQKNLVRETPWGTMSYMEYRERTEFGQDEYDAIDGYCRERSILWFASCWDLPSVDFVAAFNPPCFKVASATLTDEDLLARLRKHGVPVLLSTGMSTVDEIRQAVASLADTPLALAHTTSTYPCPPDQLNLRMIQTLADEFGIPVGYSGHETGLQASLAAVALGACFVERHITLDRAMWGSDQAASLEPGGLQRLVRDIRIIETAMGDGVKRVYDSELAARAKLRRS